MPSNVTLASETLGIVICENANGPAGGTPDCAVAFASRTGFN